MSEPTSIACTSEMIDSDYTLGMCSKSQGLHTTTCKAHCLEYHHEPTACIFDICCEETPI